MHQFFWFSAFLCGRRDTLQIISCQKQSQNLADLESPIHVEMRTFNITFYKNKQHNYAEKISQIVYEIVRKYVGLFINK